jgi:hypothetical protein
MRNVPDHYVARKNVAHLEKDGDYFVLPEEFFVDDLDYCCETHDERAPALIWSIGRRHSDGKILASLQADLYQNDDYECLWLR